VKLISPLELEMPLLIWVLDFGFSELKRSGVLGRKCGSN
jgi:hypothetical protein